MNELSTYQIFLILLGYLTERNDDTEMLKNMLIELYKRTNKTEDDKCHYCEHNFTPYKGNTGEFEQEPYICDTCKNKDGKRGINV